MSDITRSLLNVQYQISKATINILIRELSGMGMYGEGRNLSARYIIMVTIAIAIAILSIVLQYPTGFGKGE